MDDIRFNDAKTAFYKTYNVIADELKSGWRAEDPTLKGQLRSNSSHTPPSSGYVKKMIDEKNIFFRGSLLPSMAWIHKRK